MTKSLINYIFFKGYIKTFDNKVLKYFKIINSYHFLDIFSSSFSSSMGAFVLKTIIIPPISVPSVVSLLR